MAPAVRHPHSPKSIAKNTANDPRLGKSEDVNRDEMRRQSEYANSYEVNERDRAVLPSGMGREEGLADDEQLSDFEEEVLSHEGGGRPMSEITGGPSGGTPDETIDGLGPMEEEVRRQAEDRPGRRAVDGEEP